MLLDNSTNSILDLKKIKIDLQSPPKYFSFTNSSTELIRITKDGFFVRGEKVPLNEDEINKVYEAFTLFMKSAEYSSIMETFSPLTELLRITEEGFFVRGEKIPQDEDEANKVYEAFITFLRSTGFYQ
jgi:hypothetical protein